MNSLLAPWLPDNALQDEKINRTINNYILDWSTTWFVSTKCHIQSKSKYLKLNNLTNNNVIHNYQHAEGLHISVPENSLIQIASAMVDKTINSRNLRKSDLILCNQLAQNCITELCKKLAISFNINEKLWVYSTQNSSETYYYSEPITDTKGNHYLQFSATKSMIINLLKSLISAPRQLPDCCGLDDALSDQITRLFARVGDVKLTVSDIKDLNVGDIISFDTAVDQPLDLIIDGHVVAEGAANLNFNSNKVELIIKRELQ